ncbi:N-6 DNA methylase [Myroides odoratimimus]|uniref:N-6 DNA methylase n=1 Tax=Myroides odoratimimus TaxID=76832 RepID=UPI0025774F91|nr:N-6 DNA methylase [Myroides odoratimimus]MDM1499491.1 N-6 DNA methylase [Myroides odoratimimus]
MSKIEQYTEALTQKLMQFNIGVNDFGYVYPQGNILDINKISEKLKQAGGKPKECDINDFEQGGKGKAKPEFIITFNKDTSTIIVIECKKQAKFHESKEFNKPNSYAVDGVLYYAKFLKEIYNVIAIAVSGTEKEKTLLDVFHWGKGQEKPQKQNKLHNIFLSPENYLKAIKGERITKTYSLDEIRETAIEFHNKLREIKVSEKQKPIFIAGILIALENSDFANSYINLTSFKSIITQLNSAIEEVLNNSDIKKNKINQIKDSFKSIGNNEKLKNISLGTDNSITWYIEQLEMKIKPMMNNADSSLDALGVFYHEFVKYSGGDGKGLGIVLTPQHLTEFMCDLADINQDSYVVDICCGSASFLISAMNKMFSKTADPDKLENIRKRQLHGIELDQDLYVLSIANMIIRKDGKSNIINGDCFDKNVLSELKIASNDRIDVGLLNPPYSQKDKEELEFVERLLDNLVQGGTACVVVPMACAIGTKFKETRKRLFSKHTLKGVFSMPDDIFYPTGTNVCVMLWEAHKPHNKNFKSFFGYYKIDGFVKRKKLGRIDANNRWENIKKDWISLYRNSEEIEGVSAKKAVDFEDEWLCEAYMKTDYTKVDNSLFEDSIREYISYLMRFGLYEDKNNDINTEPIPLETSKWKEFNLIDLFKFKRGTRLTKENRIEGDIPLVTAGEDYLGVKSFISNEEQEVFERAITIDMFCNSYVHEKKFCCDDNVIVLYRKPKEQISIYSKIFISTIIKLDKYRYQYGRQYRQKNLKTHIIKLPSLNGQDPDWDYMDRFIKTLPFSNKI